LSNFEHNWKHFLLRTGPDNIEFSSLPQGLTRNRCSTRSYQCRLHCRWRYVTYKYRKKSGRNSSDNSGEIGIKTFYWKKFNIFIAFFFFLSIDLDPCINVSCDYFGFCKAFSSNDARCTCIEQCPSFEDPVCASNGRTFNNLCLLKREVCRTAGNYTFFHPGNCHGYYQMFTFHPCFYIVNINDLIIGFNYYIF
jgi:hypothetical protein